VITITGLGVHDAPESPFKLTGMRINQSQTYRAEVRGHFMWSPRRNANGVRNQFYENMRAVRPGDVVFSFCDTRIKAIGLVIGVAQNGPKPDFGSAGPNWSDEGWFVPVYYVALESQIRPKDHIDVLRPFLPVKYSPLRWAHVSKVRHGLRAENPALVLQCVAL
jgi:hypothetical protein